MEQKIMEEALIPSFYRNYVFDLYGTLVNIKTTERNSRIWEKLSLFMGFYGAVYEAAELKEAYHLLIDGRESHLKEKLGAEEHGHEASPEIEIVDVFRELYSLKGVRADDALVIHTGQLFRIETLEHLKLYEGTREMLQELKDGGKKIWLLSNAQRIFTVHELSYLDIERFFNGILISSDYQAKKPDQRFFHLLTEKFGIGKAGTLFVGNDATSDIAGAREMGLDTYYVHSNISPKKDAELLEKGQIPADYIIKDFKKWDGIDGQV